jgi:membrane protein required for colicin V production
MLCQALVSFVEVASHIVVMIFDILFLVFIGIGFYQGYKNGIIYSLFSLAGWFLGIMFALKFSYKAVALLQGFAHLSPKVLAIIAFVSIVILVLLLMKLIAWGLEQILKSFSLDIWNQIAGGIIHSLIGLYVLCVCIWFVNRLEVFPDEQKKTSHVYPYVENLAPQVVDVSATIVPMFGDIFDKFDELFGTQLHSE